MWPTPKPECKATIDVVRRSAGVATARSDDWRLSSLEARISSCSPLGRHSRRRADDHTWAITDALRCLLTARFAHTFPRRINGAAEPPPRSPIHELRAACRAVGPRSNFPFGSTASESRSRWIAAPEATERESGDWAKAAGSRVRHSATVGTTQEDGLAAELELAAPRVRPGGQLGYRIVNSGSVTLVCGVGYSLERETTDGWTLENPRMAFPAIGLLVEPGASRELRANIPNHAAAGRYRIGTSVHTGHGEGLSRVRLCADFEVRDN